VNLRNGPLNLLRTSLGALALAASLAAQATAVGDLAAQMKPGEWRELPTNGFKDILLPNFPGSADSPIIEFTDKAVRNSLTRKVYFLGCARGGTGGSGIAYVCGNTSAEDAGFIQYDEDTNTWSRLPTAPVNSAPHGYNHAAMNPANGDYFYWECRQLSNPKVWKYSTGQWTTLPVPSTVYSGFGALEFFPEMNALVFIDGGDGLAPTARILPAGASSWSSVSIGQPIGTYSNFSRYSAQYKLLYFGGGTNGDRVLAKMDAQGRVTRGADAPIGLGVGGTGGRQVVDPVSGNLLALASGTPGTGSVYSYDPAANQWTKHGTHPLGTAYGQVIAFLVAIPEHGVVMAVNYNYGNDKVYLYKHAAGTGATVDTAAPPVPAGVKVQ